MSAGLIWIKKNQVKKDYSKWLGPEWKIENAHRSSERMSIQIS